MNLKWIRSVFTLELRQIITYRADFWVNFVGSSAISFIIAYYLWNAIYNSLDTTTLRGFTMDDMILYYLIAPQIMRAQQGSGIGTISREIYDGSLNKYLLYPLNIFHYKIVVFFAHTSFYLLQFGLILIGYKFFIGLETPLPFGFLNFLTFLIVLYFCALLYFAMSSLCELSSFWADNIWSLSVIIRFSTSFLGGALIPLTFFPEWANTILNYTPFPYLITFPINILMKELPLITIFENLAILILWTLFFFMIGKLVWHRGKFKYTGVGI